MNVNHIHTELNKIDSCMEKLYKKLDEVAWHNADNAEVAVIQDYIDEINAKLSTYRARVGMEFNKIQGADYAASSREV